MSPSNRVPSNSESLKPVTTPKIRLSKSLCNTQLKHRITSPDGNKASGWQRCPQNPGKIKSPSGLHPNQGDRIREKLRGREETRQAL